MSKKGTKKVARSAITGRFITKKKALQNPRTTIIQTVKKK